MVFRDGLSDVLGAPTEVVNVKWKLLDSLLYFFQGMTSYKNVEYFLLIQKKHIVNLLTFRMFPY